MCVQVRGAVRRDKLGGWLPACTIWLWARR